jgi:Effector-associated domain 11/SIR2-like domain
MSHQFNSPEWQNKIKRLTTDLKRKQCVVLLGPEIVKFGDKTVRQALREHLDTNHADDIAHYYERDGFFLFREEIAKQDVQREVAEYYDNLNTDSGINEAVFKQLVQLKTHLVLSINPDSFLSDVAYKYGIKHRFAYFQHGGEAVAEVEEPTIETPLFYNLCGSTERDDSLVLDYDDLFSLLSSLLNSPGLPQKLKKTLQEDAKQYLFIGFDFDKWYSQLLLRLLSGKKAIRKFAIDPSVKEENTTIFLVKQFGIEFIEDETAFLEAFFKQCTEQNLMRDINESQTPNMVRVIQYIQNNEILKALTFANDNLKDANAKKTVTVRLANYHDLKARQEKGMIDSRDYAVQMNQIIDALLETIKTPF